MHYYKRIRELRDQKKLTQREIGEILKMPQTQYIRYEKGERDPSTEMLLKMTELYETSIDYILGKTDERTSYPPSKE